MAPHAENMLTNARVLQVVLACAAIVTTALVPIGLASESAIAGPMSCPVVSSVGTIPTQTTQQGSGFVLDTAAFFTTTVPSDPLTYSANGLPPGLVINATTGVILGTAVQAGPFSVTVTATDLNPNVVACSDISASITFQLNVKASPTLTTTASPAVALGGASPTLSDSAVLAGGYLPTESITFTLTGPGGFSYTQTDTVSGNGTYTASDTLPTTGTVAGTYTWSVSYPGDSNNNSATDQGGSAEQTVVSASSPTLTTTASPAVTLGGASPTLSDSAVLAGGYFPTESITFTLTGPGGFSYTQTDTVSGNGTYTASDTLPTTGTVAGTYTWSVSYPGDSNNNSATDQGGSAEQTVVSAPSPTLPSPPITINLCPNGEATCAAARSSTPGGSATATNDGITVTAYGGEGTFYVGQYGSDPDASLSSGTGEYFDVMLEPGYSFTSLTITDTDLSGGNSLVWWNGSAWVAIVGDPGPTYSAGPPPTVTVTLNNSTAAPPTEPHQTSPTLAELTATAFGVVTGASSASLPGTPTGLTAMPGNGSASFSWQAPSTDGGAAVTSYTLSCSTSGSVATASTSATLSGLSNGTTYSCSVAATNASATGTASSSVSVTPSAPVSTPSPSPTPTPIPAPTTPVTPTVPVPSSNACSSYTGNGAFLCSAYEELLGRAPDASGLSTFEAPLSSGVSRTQVASEILGSTEYEEDLVKAIYENYLGRPADPAGLSTFVGLLSSGATEQQVIAHIVGSPEFFSDAGSTDQGFLTLAYQKILGRSPDPAGLATFIGMLDSGTSPTQVPYDILSSNEYRTDTIGFYYRYLLGRAPDPGGLSTWLSLLSSGGTLDQSVSGVVGSAEYYNDATST